MTTKKTPAAKAAPKTTAKAAPAVKSAAKAPVKAKAAPAVKSASSLAVPAAAEAPRRPRVIVSGLKAFMLGSTSTLAQAAPPRHYF